MGAYGYLLADAGVGTYPAAGAHRDAARQVGAGADVDAIGDLAVMVHGGGGVDDAGLSDPGAYVDHGTGEYHAASGHASMAADCGARMNNGGQAGARGGQCFRIGQPNAIGAYADHDAVELLALLEQGRQVADDGPGAAGLPLRPGVVEEDDFLPFPTGFRRVGHHATVAARAQYG